jgi:hypothetical protein
MSGCGLSEDDMKRDTAFAQMRMSIGAPMTKRDVIHVAGEPERTNSFPAICLTERPSPEAFAYTLRGAQRWPLIRPRVLSRFFVCFDQNDQVVNTMIVE